MESIAREVRMHSVKNTLDKVLADQDIALHDSHQAAYNAYKGGNEYQRKANTDTNLTIHAIILPSVNPVKRQISLPLNISPFPLLQLNMFQLSSTAVTTPMY